MNFKDNKAIYLQIADKICDDVMTGVHPRVRGLLQSGNTRLR